MRECLNCQHWHGKGRKSFYLKYDACNQHQHDKCAIDRIVELLPLVEVVAITLVTGSLVKALKDYQRPKAISD